MIAIVDLGIGNPPSIQNMFSHVGVPSHITRSLEEIQAADGVVLPGVGAFDAGMRSLHALDLVGPVRDVARSSTPLLGICLGMQLLASSSEEGAMPGLGIVPATFRTFPPKTADHPFPVPHMGWNRMHIERPHPLFEGLDGSGRFYFVHSYHAADVPEDHRLGTTTYGAPFVSAYGKDNVAGVQFHPEKSHLDGMKVLKNFGRWVHGA